MERSKTSGPDAFALARFNSERMPEMNRFSCFIVRGNETDGGLPQEHGRYLVRVRSDDEDGGSIARHFPADRRELILSPGTAVVVEGLLQAPEYNGRRGIIQSFDESKGRYQVAYIDGRKKPLGVRSGCVRLEAFYPPARNEARDLIVENLKQGPTPEVSLPAFLSLIAEMPDAEFFSLVQSLAKHAGEHARLCAFFLAGLRFSH